MRKYLLLLVCFFSILPLGFAEGIHEDNKAHADEEPFDQMGMIMHHIADSHSWMITSVKDHEGQEHALSIPLPIILYSNGNWHFFSSSSFEKTEKGIVESNGTYFILAHNKIYITNSEGNLTYNDEHHIINEKPLDLSITRNVASMWISMSIILLIFLPIAKRYRHAFIAPKGIQSFFEPIILFVRDDIVYTQIGKEKSHKFLPYLMTLFFFIWINNILGLVPFFPGGSNLSGNIAFTMILALFTFIITTFSGSKTYWKHIFTAPGIPALVKPILVPVEFLGIFTKPFALMIRLFANITAGHVVILSLISMIFVFKTIYVAPASILLVLVMSMLELLVGVLQAYIFTLLTALFIGMAIHEEEHH